MKALVKLAICGMIAVAMQAHAQSAQLQGVARTQAGKAFLSQMGLGANATAAELAAAMNKMKLSPVQQAAITKAIGQFNSQAVAGNGTSVATRNEEIAKSLFGKAGELLKPTTQANNADNTAVAKAAAMTCSREELATKLSAGTSVSYADALAALNFWGARISVGTCSPSADVEAAGLIGYGPAARENFLQAAVAGMNKLQGMKDYSGVSLTTTWEEALKVAFADDAGAVPVSSAKAAEVVASLKNKCHILELPN